MSETKKRGRPRKQPGPYTEIRRENLKRFLKQASLTSDDLAALTGLRLDRVRDYMQGKREPDFDAWTAIGRALGRPVEDFNEANPPKLNTPIAGLFLRRVGRLDDDLEKDAQRVEKEIANIREKQLERIRQRKLGQLR